MILVMKRFRAYPELDFLGTEVAECRLIVLERTHLLVLLFYATAAFYGKFDEFGDFVFRGSRRRQVRC